MRRKDFLSLTPGLLLGSMAEATVFTDLHKSEMLIPQALQAGDQIGICSPAGYVELNEIEAAIQTFQRWGLVVVIGGSIGKRDGTFGGTDLERKEDLQQFIRNPAIKAIMCARGGYGLIRIIDEIDFSPLLHYPKWIIGFSDITVLHSHLSRQVAVASIHAKMCTSFPAANDKPDADQLATIESIRQALFREPIAYPVQPHPANRLGKAQGLLVGGNLKTLETLAGSRSAIQAKGRILFLEDTGEYTYSIDRMFWNLKRAGVLDELAGLIIGGFKMKQAEQLSEEFGKSLTEIVLEKISHTSYPVCFQFPVGHQRNNYALTCGVMHTLMVESDQVSLTSIDNR